MKLPVTFILVMLAHYCFACSCDHSRSVLQAFHDSDLIIQGRVINKSIVPLSQALKENAFDEATQNPFSNSSIDIAKVEVRMIHTYKGLNESTVTIFTPISETVCGYSSFREGEEYIIYANESCFLLDQKTSSNLSNTFWTNQCSRTNIYTKAEADELNFVLKTDKTFYYSKFNIEDLTEITSYIEDNELDISWEQSNDLQAAQQLNHYLSLIEYGSYVDVGFYLDKNGVQRTNFYFNGKKTSELAKKTSPIQIYYQNVNSKVMLQATVSKDFFESIKICYASNHNRIILANWQDNQIDGHYTEYDINGIVRVEGEYKQIATEPHPIDYSDLPYSFWNKRDTSLIVSKKSVKIGTWSYFNENGSLKKEESF
jgi:antitoxin component YwqK of YwqJK toxin-antitoxin module